MIYDYLETLMTTVHPPDHLKMLLSLLLHNIPHQPLQLVIFIIPGGEQLATLRHHLLKLIVRDVHEPAGAQHLQQLA